MEVFVKPPSNPNKLNGFTLLEVMLSGVLLMIFVFSGNQIIQQGAQERQKREELGHIFNHLDGWTAEIKQKGFLSDSLTIGFHQRSFVTLRGNAYLVRWHVQNLTPFLKSITFQIYAPDDNQPRHEWKSSLLYEQ